MTTAQVKPALLRTGALLVTSGVLLGILAACSPGPEPTPTKTALFASEEEAFAAAEETYRAYTDALNEVDTSDPQTFERVFEYTTGDFENRDRKNLSTMHAENYVMKGQTTIGSFTGTDYDPGQSVVHGTVCVDVSQTDILNADGESVVAVDRPDVYGAEVAFSIDGDTLRISRADKAVEGACDGV